MTENGSNDLSPGLAELDKRGVRLYVWNEGATFLDIGQGW